jgi:L-proline amide hydrolase
MDQERIWLEAAHKLLKQLPEDIQTSLVKHEEDGTIDDPEYQKAKLFFLSKHMCRLKPLPADMMSSLVALQKDSTVNSTMYAPLPSQLLAISTIFQDTNQEIQERTAHV